MNSLQISRIYTLHRFLATKRKLIPKAVAKKIGVSRSTLFRDLDILKDIGAPITYCKLTKIHYYTEDFQMSRAEFFEKLF